MTTHVKRAVLGLAALGLLTAGAGCGVSTKHVMWDADGVPQFSHDENGEYKYHVVYHPNAQAYFDPFNGHAYWYEDGAWWQGNSLPRHLFDNTDTEWKMAEIVPVAHQIPVWGHDGIAARHGSTRTMPPRFDPFCYGKDLAPGSAVASVDDED